MKIIIVFLVLLFMTGAGEACEGVGSEQGAGRSAESTNEADAGSNDSDRGSGKSAEGNQSSRSESSRNSRSDGNDKNGPKELPCDFMIDPEFWR